MGRTRSRRGKGSRRKRSSRQKAQNAAAVPAAAGQASSSKPISLDNFATLPHELKVYIAELACRRAPRPPLDADAYRAAHPHDDKPLPHPHLDIDTTLSLVFASKSLYALMAPILYRHVWISRPSALASFHLALSTRPQLGSLVHSLHVGPDKVPPYDYGPVVMEEGRTEEDDSIELEFVTSSLHGEAARRLLPRWWGQGRDGQWELNNSGFDPPSWAVDNALHAAQNVIDVDLRWPTRSYRQQELSEQEYTTRIWEVQAAFDAYLLAMRIWEDAQDVPDAQEGVEERHPIYPPLVITGYPTSATPRRPASSTEAPFVVSRTSLLQHLARPHSSADRFDHPLLFARSGLEEEEPKYGRLRPDSRSSAEAAAGEAWAGIFSPTTSSLDYSLPHTATVSSLLDLVRSVLVLTRHVETLSLTGFLELAICNGFKTSLELNSVRSLSLGPRPQSSLDATPLRARFRAVEDLRIGRVKPHGYDVNHILFGFPALRKVTWSVAGRCDQSQTPRALLYAGLLGETANLDASRLSREARASLRRLVDRLAGVGEPSFDEQSSPADAVESASTHSSSSSSAYNFDPLLEVRMDSLDLENLLQSVTDPAVRLAWTTGVPSPNQSRRLLLTTNPHTMARPVYYNEPNMPEEKDLFQEGREWWVERCRS